VAFAFIGPGSLTPGSGNGAFQVDASLNIGFGTNLATPTGDSTNAVFGRVITIASSSDPGLALRNLSTGGGKYILYARSNGRFVIWDDTAFRPRLFIDSNGNVGIPGSGQFFFTPSSTLQVAGNIQTDAAFVGSMPATSIVGGAFSSSNYAFPSSLAIGTTTYTGLPTSGLYVNGNVGIGTIAPTSKLEVAEGSLELSGTTGFSHGILMDRGPALTTTALQGSIFTEWNGLGNAESLTSRAYSYKWEKYDGSDWMAISAAGNVGIGTSTPSQLLTVGNNNQFTVGNTGFVQANNYQCNGGSCYYSWGGDTTIYRDAAAYDLGLRSGTNPMTFRVYNTYTDASNYERLDISGNAGASYAITSQAAGTGTARNIALMGGNVGVGTITPGQKLTVAGTIESTTGGIKFPDGSVQVTAGGNSSSIGWVRSGTYVTLATSTDFVGIGIATPSAKLHVSGGDILLDSTKAIGSSISGYDVMFDSTATYKTYVRSNGSVSIQLDTGNNDADTQSFIINKNAATGGTELFRVQEGGNVGVGTSTPSEALSVVGNIKATGNVIAGGTMTANVGASNVSAGSFGTTAGKGNYRFEGAATTNDVLKIDATNERVGVGTASPVTKLTSYGQGDNMTLQSGGDSTGVRHNLVFQGGATNIEARIQSGNYGGYNGGLDFQVSASQATASTTTNSALFIQAGGNVGIGTTAPGAKLEVTGTSGGRYARIADNGLLTINYGDSAGDTKFITLSNSYGNTGNLHNILFKSGDGTTQYNSAQIQQGHESSWTSTASTRDSYLSFFTSLDGAMAEKVRITSDGNVGIGTTTPAQMLQVYGGSTRSSAVFNVGTANYNFGLYRWTGVAGQWRSWHLVSNGTNGADLDFQYGPDAAIGSETLAPKVTFQGGGNVGIGTVAPSSTLHVIGDIRASGNVIAGGTMTANVGAPNVSAGTFGTTAGKGNYTFEAAASTNNVLKIDATNERVGIGTGSPGARLDILDNYPGGTTGRNDWARLGRIVAGALNNGYGLIGEGFYIDGNTYKYRYGDTAAKIDFSTGDIKFSGAGAGVAGNAITWNDNLTIKSTGNVGIGTTGPNTKLEVRGTTRITRSDLSSTYLDIKDYGTGSLQLSQNAGNLGFNTTVGSSVVIQGGGEKTIIGSTDTPASILSVSGGVSVGSTYDTVAAPGNGLIVQGNVGIGTTAPRASLEVNANDGVSPSIVAANVVEIAGFSDVAQAADITITAGSLESGGPTAKNGSGYWNITTFPSTITLNTRGWWTYGGMSFTASNVHNYPAGGGNRLPASFLIEASADGVIWSTEADITDYTSALYYKSNILSGGGKYVRITARAPQSGEPTSKIANIQIFNGQRVGKGPFSLSAEGNAVFIGGKVGIGTTTPSQVLSVQGNILATGNIIAGGTMTANVGAPNVSAGTFGTTAGKGNYTFEAAANTNNVLKIDATNERVGIGITSPATTLDVNGDIHFGTSGRGYNIYQSYLALGETMNSASTILGNNIKASRVSNGSVIHFVSGGDPGNFIKMTYNSGISFHTNVTSTLGADVSENINEKMRIDLNGNVGIGTTAPSDKLTVGIADSGTTPRNSAVLNVFNSNTTVGASANIAFGQTGGGSVGFSRMGVIYQDRTSSSEDQDMFFGTVGAGTYGERMRITSIGNVGIGTTAPATNLEIFGKTSAAAGGQETLRITNKVLFSTVGSGPKLVFYGQDSDVPLAPLASIRGYVFGSSLSGLAFETGYNANAVKMVIDNTGNVGIGTTTPASTLHVIGDIRASGNVIAGGTMTANVGAPNVSAGTFGTTAGKGNYTFEAAASTNNVLKIDATNERVGIGTTSPGATLQIGGTSSTVWINNDSISGLSAGTLIIKQKGNTFNDGFLLTDTSGAQSQLTISNIVGTSTYAQIQAQYSTGYRDLIFQPYGGNVGIGTTNPSAKLDVAGSINAQSLNASVITGANASFTGLLQTGSGGASDGIAVNGFATITGQTSIGTNVITGTDATLDIRSLADSGRNVAKITSFNNVGGLLFNEYRDNGGSASTPLWVINSYANNPIAIYPGLNSGSINFSKLVYFNPSGNVSLGTYGDAGYKLYVAGTGFFDNPVNVGSPTVGGHAATKSYVDSMFSGATSIFSSTYGESFNLSKFAYLEKADELRWKTPVNTERWNGTAWETWSSPPNFAYATDGLGNTEVPIPNTTSQFRLTYQTDACLAPYALIQQDYMTDRFNLRIETSADQVSWTQHNYASGLTGFQNVVNIGDDNCRGYYRFSFEVYYFYDATFRLVGLQLVSTRPASQGGMMETLLPITWDTSRNIGVVGKLTVSGSGNSSFVGNVGIGTTTPGSYKLYVAGGAKFDNPIEVGSPTAVNHAATKSYVDSLLGTGGSGTSTASFGTIYVAGTSTLAATGGRVNIGANLPAVPSKVNIDGSLQVIGTMSATAFYDYDNTSYYINPNSSNIGFKTLGSVQSDGAIDNNYFMANTLIGTATNPGTYKFAVSGTSYFSGISYFNSQINVAAGQQLVFATSTNSIVMGGGDISSVGKLTVTTIDPLYEIDGEKYATYASSIAGGVKEEFVGRGTLAKISNSQCSISNQTSNTNDSIDTSLKTENCKLQNYVYIIDFNKVERGSDLWVWYQAIDFSRDNVEVMATAYGIPVAIAYEIKEKKIIFKTNLTPAVIPDLIGDPVDSRLHGNDREGIEFSFRLVGKRHDWKDWPTYSKDQTEKASFILKAK